MFSQHILSFHSTWLSSHLSDDRFDLSFFWLLCLNGFFEWRFGLKYGMYKGPKILSTYVAKLEYNHRHIELLN